MKVRTINQILSGNYDSLGDVLYMAVHGSVITQLEGKTFFVKKVIRPETLNKDDWILEVEVIEHD